MRLALILILALTATACGTVSSQQLATETPQPTLATLYTPMPTPTPLSTETPAPQASPASTHRNEFAYAQHDRTIWLVDADSFDQRELVSEPLGSDAAWSPDGKYVAYQTPRGTLELLDVDSGQKTTLDDGLDGLVRDAPPPEWVSATAIEYYKADTSVPGGRAAWIASVDGERIAESSTNPPCVSSTPSCDFFVSRQREEDHDGYGASLYLVRRSTSKEQLISTHSELLGWSPDGRWLAFYANARGGSAMTGEVHVLEAETGRDIELGTFNTDENAGWAPTSARLIFYNLEIDPATGAVKELFPRPSAGISWSPDLSKVAFVEGDPWGKASLITLDLKSGKRTELLSIDTDLSHPQVPGLGGAWSPDGRYLSYGGWTDGRGDIQDFYLFDSYSGSETHVLTLSHASNSRVSYSRDWSRLLIAEQLDGQEIKISVANPDGSSPMAIDRGLYLLRQPWRPTAGAKPSTPLR